MNPDPRARFLDAVATALADGRFVKATLGAPRGEGDDPPRQVQLRPVVLKGGPRVQAVWRYARRDRTENLRTDEVLPALDAALGPSFHAGHLHTTDGSVQTECRDGRWRTRTLAGATAPATPAAHDRPKQRPVDLDQRWLAELGLVDEHGRTVPGMQDKRRQVARFVEVLSHVIGERPPADVRAVDLGCGKGYLTFATWDWLVRAGGGAPRVTGVELRPPLVDKIEGVARRLALDGLQFAAGAIAEHPLDGVDLVIALHACDTATDDALARGIAAGARWILVAPCCHREVRPQLTADGPMAHVWRHGILAHREAEIATDALRAALLESAGYEARVFEFISAEHTDKNLMIAAIRRGEPRPEAASKAREIAAFYGVKQQALATWLGVSL